MVGPGTTLDSVFGLRLSGRESHRHNRDQHHNRITVEEWAGLACLVGASASKSFANVRESQSPYPEMRGTGVGRVKSFERVAEKT